MDIFDVVMLLCANWNTWNLLDLCIMMFQESDESEDSYWPILLAICADASESDVPRGRNWWVFPKSESWWEVLAKQVWHSTEIDRDQLWRAHFRMPYGLFLQLVDLIEPFMPPLSEWPLVRKRLELEKCVALVLYRFAHNASLLELSDKFHVGQAGCVKYTRIMIEILSNRNKLHGQFVGLPKGDRLDAVIRKFRDMSGVPLVAGVIDGCQIRLKKKPEARHLTAEYWNRHHHHSVLLQGVSDADRNFLDVACLLPGSQHDATHLRYSSLWHKLTNNLILQSPELTMGVPAARRGGRARAVVEEVTVLPFLIGDAAYPLVPFLMKAFDTRRTGTQAKNDFDKALRRCRVRIEHSFGLLKSRWRILDTGCPLKIEDVSTCVLACCTLHNFINYGGVTIREADRERDLLFDPFRDSEPFLNISERTHRYRENAGKKIQRALFEHWRTAHHQGTRREALRNNQG